MADTTLTFEDSKAPEVLQYLQKPINIAASKGDEEYVKRLLTEGANPNDKDIYGRTPLHYAVNNGHAAVLYVLLANGADVACTTNKGRTPLHTASYKGDTYSADALLQNISSDRLNDFVNTKDICNGNTALHVAVKGGYMELVELLLKNGATYNAVNKEGKIPIHLSKDEKISNLLKLIEEFYRDIGYGNTEALDKLRGVQPHEFFCIINTQNCQGHTLHHVALAGKHATIADTLLSLKQRRQLEEQKKLKLNQFRVLKDATETLLRYSYLPMLRDVSIPKGSEKNPSRWATVKAGSYYLHNAFQLVSAYRQYSPGPINNKNIKSVNEMLETLEFSSADISYGYTDEAYGGRVACFVSKGQGKKYYELLHSEQKEDLRLFIKLVERHIETPVKIFSQSIDQIAAITP